jgi:hypothetical protein
MIGVGALAVIVAGATPTMARDASARHFVNGAFAYHGQSHVQRPRNYPPAAMRSMMTWDSYGLRWDSAE